MSEGAAERSFDPTPSRLARARREGDMPRAMEFSANAAFIGGIASALAVTAPIGSCARDALVRSASQQAATVPLAAIAALALVPCAGAAIAGVAASLLQNGGVHVHAPSLKLERLAPAGGVKRIVSRDTLGQSVRASVAFAVAAAAVCSGVVVLLGAHGVPAVAVAGAAWERARVVLFVCAGIGLLFGLAEFAAARRSWLRRLRMTLDEVRRDMKEQDGDPRTRSRRKAAHRAILRGSLAHVKDASFVVVNPTHVAIALRYDPPRVAVPHILVRATGEAALRVREIARDAGIPIVENVALARALLADGEAGHPIPVEHYVAVAEIVAALARSAAETLRQ